MRGVERGLGRKNVASLEGKGPCGGMGTGEESGGGRKPPGADADVGVVGAMVCCVLADIQLLDVEVED